MCGIFFYITNGKIVASDKPDLEKRFNTLEHRGPDQKRVRYYNSNVMLGFHRLAIVDPEPTGLQPFETSRYASITNGEIYNYKQIKEDLITENIPWKTYSDCEVILHLFQFFCQSYTPKEALEKLCQSLDGEYSFIIYDIQENVTYFATDELSMRPLFIGENKKGIYLASEQKALTGLQVTRLPAARMGYIENNMIRVEPHYDLSSIKIQPISFEDAALKLRDLLIANTINKLHADREFVFLLSGGIDSSLICSIAAKYLHPVRIRTFTVGFSTDSTDILAARKVAKHINSIHTEFICSYSEALEILPFVVRCGETWDQTSNRSSVPMHLCVKKIKEKHPEVAVIFSGEVADELLRGYLYNRNCPSLEEGRRDQIMRLENLHTSDGLRADRTTSAYSMECRFPFFSRDILNFVLSLPMEYLDPKHNNNIEKYILRQAFDLSDNEHEYLPRDILWRRKAAFSDSTSVKSGWKGELIKFCETEVTDSRFAARKVLYPYCTPQTKEDMYYRELFEEYGYEAKTISFKWLSTWCGDITDSSASILDVFDEDQIQE
tara:strand:- start:1274 stop:2926 length:1653 start_codon:yes stop_codon:yes gene_type:complete